MGADTFLLQREAIGGPGWLQAVAYAAAVIVASLARARAWALGLAETRAGARSRGTLGAHGRRPPLPS
jgi:hypothetical protein